VSSAYNTIANLSSTFTGETGTSFGGSGSITATSGTKDASGNFVFTTTATNFLSGGALTITGSASDTVVINVTGNNNVQLKNLLSLSGGITDDMFNIDNTIIDGLVIGGSNQDFQLVSGFVLNAPSVVPTPEPTSLTLLGGFGVLGALG
jgi:hypothetical protein